MDTKRYCVTEIAARKDVTAIGWFDFSCSHCLSPQGGKIWKKAEISRQLKLIVTCDKPCEWPVRKSVSSRPRHSSESVCSLSFGLLAKSIVHKVFEFRQSGEDCNMLGKCTLLLFYTPVLTSDVSSSLPQIFLGNFSKERGILSLLLDNCCCLLSDRVTYKLQMICDVTFPENENDVNVSP